MDNIIRAVFCGSRYTTTKSVFQIDKGDVLQFVGLDLPEYYEVHFSNSKNDLAKRVIATGDSVVIPPEFMKHGKKEIFAWVYLTPEADVGYTPYQVTIPLNLRSDISDAEPDPEQDDIVEQAIAALNDGVERAETAAEDAERSADEAKEAAENIQQAVEDALQEAKESGDFDGKDGANGVTYTPTVDAEGGISWVNDGGLPNPQPRNIKGPQGEKLTYNDLTPADKADLVQGPIAEAQTAAVEAVNQAGTTQVENVNTAGATQVQAVANKGTEVIDSIPSDYTELSKDVADLKSALTRNTNFVFSADNEIQSIQYYVYKVENGVINRYTNPSGYWKTLFAPVDCLYIDGTATMKSGGLSGNQSQGIPSMAFIDEDYNVLSAVYTAITAPSTFSRLDVPPGAVYVVCHYAENFTFSFQSVGGISTYCKDAVNASTELTGDVVTLTYESATGYYTKNKLFNTYSGVATAKISVSEGERYLLDSQSYYDAAIACLLNTSDVVQSTVWISNNAAQQRNILIEIPAGISYLLIQRFFNYKPTILRKVTGIKAKSVQSILNGKRVAVIGDSITELNLRANMNWALWINEWANATIQNLGKSGTGFIAGGTNNYASRIASISNPDIIGVACSFNDMNNTIADLTTAAETFFDNLITAYPTTPIICYVQSPWSAYHYGVTTSDAWVNALKEICNTRGIPFYDGMYKGTVLKPWLAANRAVYYINDGDGNTGEEDWVHPNSEGHKAIARYLYPKFVENLVATGLDYLV